MPTTRREVERHRLKYFSDEHDSYFEHLNTLFVPMREVLRNCSMRQESEFETTDGKPFACLAVSDDSLR